MEKDFQIVKLSDKREVKVTELTGLDEMIAMNVTGKELDNSSAGIMQYRYVLMCFSIVEIDGKKIERPKNLTEVRAFMAQFKIKDTTRISTAYYSLNTDAGEQPAVESEN